MTTDFRFYLNRQGIRGRKGEQGEQGYSPTITVKSQTANEYVLTVQNEDGSFDTPNLRGNAIENRGGTYIRYNPATEEMYTGDADLASTQRAGVVFLSTYEQLIAGGSENLIPTSQDVYNFVSQQIISGFVTQQEFDTYTAATAITLNNLSTQKLSFADLSNAIVAGDNITLDIDSENNTITVNATGGDLSNYVTLDTVQTITNSKTFDGNGVIHFSNTSNGVYFEDSSSTERIRIFTTRHSSGTDYSDLTMQSYSDMQFRLLSPATTVKLTDIITSNTLANSAVQPADLANYVTTDTAQEITGRKGFTSEILASGGITLPTGNSINFHSPTTGSSGIISSPSANTLQLRANTININSGGSSPIIKNLFDMVQLSDLSIASTSSNWLDYDNTTGEFSANVDTVVTQNSNNLITSDAVYDGLETKADKSQMHALKSYSDNGELLTDAEGLANVTKYAHSTFDLSKFDVVGSPNITDDGIASGFSRDNYITVSTNIDNTASKVEVFFEVDAETATVTNHDVLLAQSLTNHPIQLNTNNNTCKFGMYTTSWTLGNTIYNANDKIQGKFEYNITTQKCTLYSRLKGATNWIEEISFTSATNPIGGTFYLGRNATNGNEYYGSNHNLKQFSITVDGVPVFSGNKTGIDTIKPDDYTVVGTPTISADGVALTGYGRTDNSNKFSSNQFDVLSDNQQFECMAYIEPLPSDYAYPNQVQNVCSFNQSNNHIRIMRAYPTTSNTIRLEQQVNGSWAGNSGSTSWGLGTTFTGWVKLKIYYDIADTCYKCDCYTINDGVETFVKTMVCNYTGSATTGTDWTFQNEYGQYQNYGKMDLNSIRVFDNSNLVYQPCLKIPYTESKTGSKIVQSVYRDRVNDMAEQFGYAPYYTLSDTDFTLPQIDLFGLIGNKTLRDSYYNGVTYWELFSNRRLEQGGTCVSGVEYTLPRPFADANYTLTIPYSSKTATSFIPSATGDFIAKGMGLL